MSERERKWHSRSHLYSPAHLGVVVTDLITAFFGSWLCILLHTIWFALWFYLKLDIALLTNVVSLEAIGLAIIIMMSQNRTYQRDKARDDLEAGEIQSLYDSHQLLLQINQRQLELLELMQKLIATRKAQKKSPI